MDETDLQTYARVRALEIILSTLLAGAAMQNKGMLDRMHEALTDLVRDAAGNIAGRIDGLTPAQQMHVTETMVETLDSVIGGARAMR